MTKAIIFDLDSSLAAADEVGEQLFAPAFAAIRAANDGSVPEEKLRAAFVECWRVAFDAVADNYGFTEAMRAASWQVFRQTEVTGPMFGYGEMAGRICRCSGFWSRPVFGGCRRARCARWVSPTGLRPFTLTRWTNRIGGANTASSRTSSARMACGPTKCSWWGTIRIPKSRRAIGWECPACRAVHDAIPLNNR